MTFAMALARRPISSKGNHNALYAQALQHAAQAAAAGAPPMTGSLYAAITWIHRRNTDQDVDNIAKRILDALSGVVYDDDRVISECILRRVDARYGYSILVRLDAPSLDQAHDVLTGLLDSDEEHILYIEVGPCGNQVIVVGHEEHAD